MYDLSLLDSRTDICSVLYFSPRAKSLSSRTSLQVIVLVLEPQVLVLVLGSQVLVLVLEPQVLESSTAYVPSQILCQSIRVCIPRSNAPKLLLFVDWIELFR